MFRGLFMNPTQNNKTCSEEIFQTATTYKERVSNIDCGRTSTFTVEAFIICQYNLRGMNPC